MWINIKKIDIAVWRLGGSYNNENGTKYITITIDKSVGDYYRYNVVIWNSNFPKQKKKRQMLR